MAHYAYSLHMAGMAMTSPGQNAVWHLFHITINNIQKKTVVRRLKYGKTTYYLKSSRTIVPENRRILTSSMLSVLK